MHIAYFLYGKGLGGNGKYVYHLLANQPCASKTLLFFCPPCEEKESYLESLKPFNVRIVNLNHEGRFAQLKENAINAHVSEKDVQAKQQFQLLKLLFYYLKLIIDLAGAFKKEKIDVVHFSLGAYPTLLHCILAAKLSGVRKIVVTMHSLDFGNCRIVEQLMNGLVKKIKLEVIVLSEKMRKAIIAQGFSADSIHVIYNGVKPEALNVIRDSSTVKTALVPARFEKLKGHSVLIDAVALLKKKGQRLLIRLAGEGELEEDLKRKIKELNVEEYFDFLGFRKDVHSLLGQSDFLILPSISESLPFAILEAMALSKPVLATDVGSVSELVIDGENGYLAIGGDPKSLCITLQKMLSLKEEELILMGKKGKKLSDLKFTCEQMLSKTYALYEGSLL